MEIRGPLKIAVAETPGQGGWELHIDFRPEFRDLPLRDQGTSFRAYLTDLASSLAGLAQDDRNRQDRYLPELFFKEPQRRVSESRSWRSSAFCCSVDSSIPWS